MSYWLQQHNAPRRNRALSPQVIAEAAVVILDSAGEDGLSLRTLAERLGVVGSSLYRHVRTREDVLDLALDAALVSDLDVADELTGGDIVRVLLAWRLHLLRHPWAITHVMRRTPLGPGYLALSNRLCALLSGHGVADEELLNTAYAMSDFVLGCVLAQRNTEASRQQWPTSLVNQDYPHLYRAVWAHQPSWETVTRHGLQRLAGNYVPPSRATGDMPSH